MYSRTYTNVCYLTVVPMRYGIPISNNIPYQTSQFLNAFIRNETTKSDQINPTIPVSFRLLTLPTVGARPARVAVTDVTVDLVLTLPVYTGVRQTLVYV